MDYILVDVISKLLSILYENFWIWEKCQKSQLFSILKGKRARNCKSVSLMLVPGKILEKIIKQALREKQGTNKLESGMRFVRIGCTRLILLFFVFVFCQSELISRQSEHISRQGNTMEVVHLDFSKALMKLTSVISFICCSNVGWSHYQIDFS